MDITECHVQSYGHCDLDL